MIRVYRYGLTPPTHNAELVRAQMRAGHEYRNTLTEIERGRRAAMREAMSSYADVAELERAVSAAEMDLERALRAVSKERARTRSRSETAEQRSAVTEARAAKKEAIARLRERRAQLRDDASVVARGEQINDLAGELRRSARAATDAYWGTYLLAEDAIGKASKAPLYDGAEPNDPRFRRWDGTGSIGVQIQHGMTRSELLSCEDTRMQIAESPRGRHDVYKVLRMRVGSDGRAPVWAEWGLKMHRAMPEDGRIKAAVVVLRRIATREEWYVTITVDEGEREATCGRGAVAMNLGWRTLGAHDIRVAVSVDEQGSKRELRLPADVVTGIARADEIRSTRDVEFERARAAMVAWIDNADALPACLSKARETLPQWKSEARLASLVRRWRDERADGDSPAFDAAEAWRKQDVHLWQWETEQRRRSELHRRDTYRCWAAELARTYSTVILDDVDLSALAKRAPKEANAENETARRARVLAAPSELRGALENAFRGRGGHVLRLDPKDVTHTCAICGVVESWDAAPMVHHACGGCGEIWDQDENAALVLLTKWREGLSGTADTAIARGSRKPAESEANSNGRWQKVRRLRAEKDARRTGRSQIGA